MYWRGNDYDAMAKLAIDIYIDYRITRFPVNEKDICDRLGIKLVPYSAFTEECQFLFRKRSNDAFYVPATQRTPPTILYNDSIKSYERQRYSIFHEVKHYANNDQDDSDYNDDMADYFARYFMCPIPYLIRRSIYDLLTVVSDHRMSEEAARHTLSNVRNRIARYGNKIFEYELPLISLLCPDWWS